MRDGWLRDIWRSRVSLSAAGSNAVKSTDAENLRVTLVILNVVALIFIVVQGVRLVWPIAAHSPQITVFAAASMKNALDDVNEAFTTRTGIKVVST